MSNEDTHDSKKPAIPDKPPKPSGVMPKNIQTWAILGLALLMVVVIALNPGGGSSSTNEETGSRPSRQATAAATADRSRIQEYQRYVQEQAKRLAQERDRLQRALTADDLAVGPTLPSPSVLTAPSRTQKSPIEQEKIERQYRSLFASNVALSYRAAGAGQSSAAPLEVASTQPPLTAPLPSLVQEGKNRAVPNQEGDGREDMKSPLVLLREGTIIETVLTNRLSGEFAGPVNSMVTTAVYSADRRHLLIPQGSRLIGAAQRVDRFGQERLAVTFHRLFLPNGFSVPLQRFLGLNQIGETGLKDKVNRHYWSIFGSALAVGAIGGLTQAGARSGFDVSAGDRLRLGAGSSLGRSSERILDRFLNRLPTITIQEGHRVKVYLAGDLFLPIYDPQYRPNPSEETK